MEERIIEVTFLDGRKFRVFCANSTQILKMKRWYHANQDQVKSFEFILNGIHTVKQFLTINN
jgi:hypothetical protein